MDYVNLLNWSWYPLFLSCCIHRFFSSCLVSLSTTLLIISFISMIVVYVSSSYIRTSTIDVVFLHLSYVLRWLSNHNGRVEREGQLNMLDMLFSSCVFSTHAAFLIIFSFNTTINLFKCVLIGIHWTNSYSNINLKLIYTSINQSVIERGSTLLIKVLILFLRLLIEVGNGLVLLFVWIIFSFQGWNRLSDPLDLVLLHYYLPLDSKSR